MAVKPILFNTEMVRAILDGRKTQTRRVVKGLGNLNVYLAEPAEDSYETLAQWDFFYGGRLPNGGVFDAIESMKAPCAVGDILWVRETWTNIPVSPGGHFRFGGQYYYKADGDIRPDGWRGNWRPSIHMPKQAVRIFLRVKDVRAERLQEITKEQVVQEGCSAGCVVITCGPWGIEDDPDEWTAIEDFQRKWDDTIKLADFDKYGWDANPWVWVIEFECCEKPENWP